MTPSIPTRIHAIVLAAGQGTRMKSALPKVLHPIGGRPMLDHVLAAARAAGASATHIVHGHGAERVRAWYAGVYGSDGAGSVHWVLQAEQKGTGHAVQQAATDALPDDATALILYGDVPLIGAELLSRLVAAATPGLAIVTVELANPKGYGRILRDPAGRVMGIVEEKDATNEQRRIREGNTGLMAAPAKRLKGWLARLSNDNAQGEFYLTDVVAMAVAEGVEVGTVIAPERSEVEGVNDRVQLAAQERVFQQKQAEILMRDGVTLADPARLDVRGTIETGRDIFLDVGVVLDGDCSLADGVRIGPYCVLKNAHVGKGTVIASHSVLENCTVGADCTIGPFARLRPETVVDDGAHVGNFVELKKTRLGKGSKANHLAYLGDAVIGSGVNVGAGVITCNYDGANKFVTTIEDDVFVGTDSQLVAPVTLGKGSYVGAGSTITKNVEAGSLTLCRARETKVVPNWRRPVKKPVPTV